MSDYRLELEHHGILGQKWGVHRFQNADGTRTAAGKKRYNTRIFDTSIQRGNAYSKMKSAERGSQERKQAREEYKGYHKALLKEQRKARYNSEVDRGKDPNKFMNSQVNRLVKNGMSRDEAELKVYGRKELARRAGLSAVVGSISAATGNPAMGAAALVGATTASDFGKEKIYDAAIQKEIETGRSAFKDYYNYTRDSK